MMTCTTNYKLPSEEANFPFFLILSNDFFSKRTWQNKTWIVPRHDSLSLSYTHAQARTHTISHLDAHTLSFFAPSLSPIHTFSHSLTFSLPVFPLPNDSAKSKQIIILVILPDPNTTNNTTTTYINANTTNNNNTTNSNKKRKVNFCSNVDFSPSPIFFGGSVFDVFDGYSTTFLSSLPPLSS